MRGKLRKKKEEEKRVKVTQDDSLVSDFSGRGNDHVPNRIFLLLSQKD